MFGEIDVLRFLRLIAGAILCVVILSCASAPDNPLRSLKTTSVAPRPDAEMAARTGVGLALLENGYTVFHRKCLDCHEPRVPRNPGHRDWHPVLTGMSWNAGLSPRESEDMITYLRAVAQ
jgi:cytochrome c5